MDFLHANLFRIFSLSLVTFFVFFGATQSSDEMKSRLHALLPSELSYHSRASTDVAVQDLVKSRADN